MSVAEKVHQRIKRTKKGVPFSASSFYGLGSATAVQKALSRLVGAGEIERLSKGVYARPKTLASLPSIKVTASAERVAQHWAKVHGYKLVRQGLESAYRLGFQTQAPVRTIFWSNGPSRSFRVGRQVVEVRHTSNSRLKWPGKPEGELLRGLLVTPANSVEFSELSNALNRLSISGSRVRELLKRLHSAPLPSHWHSKLEAFERNLT